MTIVDFTVRLQRERLALDGKVSRGRKYTWYPLLCNQGNKEYKEGDPLRSMRKRKEGLGFGTGQVDSTQERVIKREVKES